MSIKRVCLDIDGVLADFNTAYHDLLVLVTGEDKFPQDYDPTQPPVWHWEHHFGYTSEQEALVWTNHILKSPDFWVKLKPLKDASRVLFALDQMVRFNEIELYFITNRHGLNAKLQTEKWLYNHGVSYPTVLIAADKLPLLRTLNPAFYIDDKLETANDVQGVSIDGLQSWLLATSWNTEGRRPDLNVAYDLIYALKESGLWKD